jgi:hypothetical protein
VDVSSALWLLPLHQQDKARGEVKELADMPSQVCLGCAAADGEGQYVLCSMLAAFSGDRYHTCTRLLQQTCCT